MLESEPSDASQAAKHSAASGSFKNGLNRFTVGTSHANRIAVGIRRHDDRFSTRIAGCLGGSQSGRHAKPDFRPRPDCAHTMTINP